MTSAATAETVAAPLTVVAQSGKAVWNAVVQAPDGRLFVAMPRLANPDGISVATVAADGSLAPYPDAGWNRPPSQQRTAGPGKTTQSDNGPGPLFVGVNALHLAPDGALWVVDTGSPGFGKPMLPHAARLIRIDLATNQVTRILTLPDAVLRPKSMIDDIRFNGDHAYITDAGAPGLVVLDLGSDTFRRVLDQAPGLTASRPIVVDGQVLRGPDGKPVMINADQLEVTPDGLALLVQPLCGPMSRIATALLDDPDAAPARVAAGLTFWYDTPALGGTAILRDGTLLLNDLETNSVLALSPDRVETQLITDPRLHWADAPFLSPAGKLLLPVPQLDRAAPFHQNKSQIRLPVMLYALDAGALLRSAAGAPAGTRSPPS
jgi:hypothetical protein